MSAGRYIWSRLVNAVRCYTGYALSFMGSVRIGYRPVFVSVEPSSVCRLHCPACPVGRAGRPSSGVSGSPYMSREVWERVLAEVVPWVHTIQFYFQGEPLLNEHLPQMISDAHHAGIYTIVSTNAQALSAEAAEALVAAGLNRIIVSMDGLTDESYKAYRVGGDVAQCKAAIGYLRAAKERQHARMCIELQCLRLRTNEHEWEDFKKTYRALGADRLVFKTAQLYDYAHGHPLMPSEERYSRYRKGEDGIYRRKALGRGCFRVWSGCVVTTTGDVLPCCYDKAHEHAYGNIMNASIGELFGNERATAFRKAALKEEPDICKECWR